MKDSHEKMNSIEINDLILNSIANAEERRKQAVLSDLSEEELAKIEGGLAYINPQILGIWLDRLALQIQPVSVVIPGKTVIG